MLERIGKRIGLFCMIAAMLLVLLPRLSGADQEYAENLSEKCRYSGDFSIHSERLKDDDFDTAQRVNKGKTVSIEWNDSVPVASVYLSFYSAPVAYTVLQYDKNGTKLSEEPGILLYNVLIETTPETRKVSFRADANDCSLTALYAYGAGEVKDYHPFLPTAEKADYLTFAMHPDDDVLFLGAVYPLYDAERGLTGVSLIMSTKLPEKFQRQRRQEDLNSSWALGLKVQPVFGGFPDIPPSYYDQFQHTFTKDDVTRYAVTQIRKYRPEVVVTQDLNGEYGHWQHKVLAEGVQAAVPLAADASYQPKGYPASEPWQVKKLYIHLFQENKLTLDVNRPIEALNGKTAFEAAVDAFEFHESQTQKNNHHVSTTEYSIAEFGLAYTTVGEDTPGVNDLFEHIDPDTLSVTPAPTATPTPEPTPEPTQEPTPEPTEAPTLPPTAEPQAPSTPVPIDSHTEPEPTALNTPEPVQTPAPGPEPDDNGGMPTKTLLLIGGGLVVLLGILLAALLILRKRR